MDFKTTFLIKYLFVRNINSCITVLTLVYVCVYIYINWPRFVDMILTKQVSEKTPCVQYFLSWDLLCSLLLLLWMKQGNIHSCEDWFLFFVSLPLRQLSVSSYLSCSFFLPHAHPPTTYISSQRTTLSFGLWKTPGRLTCVFVEKWHSFTSTFLLYLYSVPDASAHVLTFHNLSNAIKRHQVFSLISYCFAL